MTTEQSELARRRLWLGITNVGFWVLTTAVGLYWLTCYDTSGFNLRRLGFTFAAAVAVQAVFDFIGGAWLMPEPRSSMMNFLRCWSRGALGHTLVLACVGLLSFASFRLTGGFCFAILLATAGLALGRRQLLRAVAGVAIKELPSEGGKILTADTSDPAFTGGIVGFGQRDHMTLARVEGLRNRADHAALAGGVAPFEDDQHAALLALHPACDPVELEFEWQERRLVILAAHSVR